MLPNSGPMTMDMIFAEFGGMPTGAVDLSILYRGGSRVKNKAANANSNVVNGAAAIPESGPFDLSLLYGAAAKFSLTREGTGTPVALGPLFGDDWAGDWTKEFTNTGTQQGVVVSASAAGDIHLINEGEIQGLGGAGGTAGAGANGTDAVTCNSLAHIWNYGAIRGGGGGGGKAGSGGTGGPGYYYYTVDSGWQYATHTYAWTVDIGNNNCIVRWGGSIIGVPSPWSTESYSAGGYTYYKGAGASGADYYIKQTYQATGYTSGGAGGAGGNGGVGRGYNQAKSNGAAGAAGAAGGTNAGAGGYGGTGGNGGDWGVNGTAGGGGYTGNSGNNGGGSAGGSGYGGGLAGKAISGSNILEEAGTINGAVDA